MDGCKFPPKNLRMGHNFGLVTISIILPGNGWCSCKLNKKTYYNLANFSSCFIVNSLEIGCFCLLMGQF